MERKYGKMRCKAAALCAALLVIDGDIGVKGG